MWTYPRTLVTGSAVTISVFIFGNLSAPSITFTNPSASVIVKGCVSTVEHVEIMFTPTQIEQLEKSGSSFKSILTQLGSNCPTPLSSITVSSVASGKTCRKIKVTKDEARSDSSNLVVMFQVNSNGCRTWWIVLAAVLGGVVLIALVIGILTLTYTPLRRNVAPFWNRRAATS